MKRQLILLLSISMLQQVFAQPGTLDMSFNPGPGANSTIYGASIQPNGKIILAGQFSQYNGATRSCLARANSDGTNDATFIPDIILGSSSPIVYCEALQSDGKIIISGSFNSIGGVARSGIARIDSTGALDPSFNPGSGINGYTYYHGLAIQPDGKIMIAGLFNFYNGVSRKYIARANFDGTLDLTFNPGTGFNAQPNTIILQPDGKMIVGGSFTSYNGISRNYIARINSDGTLDTTFDPGSGTDSYVNSTSLQPDGKILIGGSFTYYNGTPAPGIVRLNSDGSVDTTFNAGTGIAGSSIYGTSLQTDGKIIVSGGFTSYNGTSRNRIARLNSNGSLDITFDPGTGAGPSGTIFDVPLQSDGKIIAAGSFTNYNGTARNRICRINGNLPPMADFSTSTDVVCGNETVTLTDLSTNFPDTWQWSVTPTTGTTISSPSSQNTTITFSSTGTFNVKLIASNVSGSDSVVKVINVYAPPVATATALGPTTFCLGGSVQLTSSAALIYLWNTGDTTQNITVFQSGNYSVTVTDGNGCSGLSNVLNVVEDSAANPGICLVSVDSALSNHNIIYWDKSGVIANIDSFRIYREVTTGLFSHIASVHRDSLSEYHDYGANPNVTSYKYKLGVLDTCGGGSLLSPFHSTIHLQVLGGGNLQWTLYEIESASNPVSFYRVLRDDLGTGNFVPISSTIPGGNTTYTDLSYAAYPLADYRVDVTWSISCEPTRATVNTTRSNIKHNSMSTGINSTISEESISVYPNPANSIISIEMSNQPNDVTIKIMNAIGQIIEETIVQSSSTKTLNKIDVSAYSKGIYTVSFESNGTRMYKKIAVN